MTKTQARKDRKRRRKYLLAIIMILFTAVVLSASTYAWFTANRTVTVESIDVTVTTSQGLQISVDATNWKSIVTNSDITGANWTNVKNQLPTGTNYLNPVSTIGTVDSNGLMEMYLGQIKANETTGNNILVAEKDTETNGSEGNFVAFDLFFQASNAATVYLTSNSSVVASGTSSGIENAARVAFIKEGSVEYGATAASAQALKGNQSRLIWEPNQDAHTASGINHARDVYGKTVGATAAKQTYVGVKAAIPQSANQALNSENATYFGAVSTVGTDATTGIPDSEYISAFDVAAGVTKVRIYMWIEGQDVDCEDHASGGSLTYSLQFSLDSHA